MKTKRMIKAVNKKSLYLVLVGLLILSGCTASKANPTNDILTLKKIEEGRTPITVLVKHAFSINNFEKIVEEKFKDIDIVQVGNYTANPTLAKEYEARLEHDDLTDIIMTWPLDVGEEYFEDRLINLSGMSFTNKYKTSMLDSIATKEGELYYLPGPASLRGIIYNKTLFAEKGWQVPANYTEFLALCKTIQASGMRPFQLPLGNQEVLDTAFIGFNYGNAFSSPKDTEWISKYLKGEGKFIEHFASSFETFQELIDNGLYQKDDLNLYYQDTQRNLLTRQIAMVEDSILLTKMGGTYGNETDEFAVMPFFNKNPENDWVRLYMTCYIGVNKHLEEKDNKDKYDKVIKLLDYISTPEGQTDLASDTEAMYSSVKGTKVPSNEEIVELVPALMEGRYGSFPTLERNKEALYEGLSAMIRGEMNAQQVATMVDEENKTPAKKEKVEVYGNVSEDFTLIETGSFVSDIIREKGSSEIGLFLDNGKDGAYNGKGVGARIYQGDFTDIDLKRILPNLMQAEKGELWNITMTGENLIKTLEDVMVINSRTGWFYYFSGLEMEFNPLAQPGSRIKSITTTDGKEIDKNKEYSIAVIKEIVPTEYIIDCKKTGLLLQDLIKEKVETSKTISPAKDNRFKIVSE